MKAIESALKNVHASALGAEPQRFRDLARSGAVGYMGVDESKFATMALFVLPARGRMPLHDHPRMSVFSKVLWGTLRVRSFDVLADGYAVQAEPVEKHKNETQMLTPDHRNVHAFFAANDEPVAVFDVVLPPYDDDQSRPCTYYADVNANVGERVKLKQIDAPAYFYCDEFRSHLYK